MKNFRKIADGTIEYHVDVENRVVVAFMYDTEYIALDYIVDRGTPYMEGAFVAPIMPYDESYLMMEYKYSARARCHPDDEFDIELGKSIARKKLLRNVQKAFDKRIRRYAKHLEKTRDVLMNNLEGIEKIEV